MLCPDNEPGESQEPDPGLLEAHHCSPWLRLAEPYWLQDVRLAQRKIEAQRLLLREPDQR